MDVFDTIVGMCRKCFSDDNIFITADHGHMNGEHGKYGYGFDLFESAINIPLITPKIEEYDYVNFPTSNVQLEEIILNRTIHKLPFIISETAYYEQPHRKIAIIKDSFKYVYEKQTKKHYLYDLKYDPKENVNLSYPEIYDFDRRRYFSISQRIFYTNWDKAIKEFKELEKIKVNIWREPAFINRVFQSTKFRFKLFIIKILKK